MAKTETTEKREIKERKGVFKVGDSFYLFSKGTNYGGFMESMTEKAAKESEGVPDWARFGYQMPDEKTARVVAQALKSNSKSASGVKKL